MSPEPELNTFSWKFFAQNMEVRMIVCQLPKKERNRGDLGFGIINFIGLKMKVINYLLVDENDFILNITPK